MVMAITLRLEGIADFLVILARKRAKKRKEEKEE